MRRIGINQQSNNCKWNNRGNNNSRCLQTTRNKVAYSSKPKFPLNRLSISRDFRSHPRPYEVPMAMCKKLVILTSSRSCLGFLQSQRRRCDTSSCALFQFDRDKRSTSAVLEINEFRRYKGVTSYLGHFIE